MLQWLFFEQYSHEPYIAVVRFWIDFGRPDAARGEIEAKRRAATTRSRAMERHLDGRRFFVADRYTIADIALYAYTHVAHEGGFDLDAVPRRARVARPRRRGARPRADRRLAA